MRSQSKYQCMKLRAEKNISRRSAESLLDKLEERAWLEASFSADQKRDIRETDRDAIRDDNCVMNEAIRRLFKERMRACSLQGERGSCYPFELEGDKLTWKKERWSDLYVFLLQATIRSMDRERMAVKNGRGWEIVQKKPKSAPCDSVDATVLFEDLCLHALKGYLGPRATAMRIGAGADQCEGFPKRFEAVCEKVCEGKVRQRDASKEKASFAERLLLETSGDCGLDVVAWLDFAESKARGGRLIVFGQCKTGTNYEIAHARRLDPPELTAEYLLEPFTAAHSNIVRVFMVAQRPDKPKAAKLNRAGGLLFDRCRIIDCLSADGVPKDLMEQMRNWLKAVRSRHVISGKHPTANTNRGPSKPKQQREGRTRSGGRGQTTPAQKTPPSVN